MKVGDLYRTMGKAFRVRCVAGSVDEANEFCLADPSVGVLDSEDETAIVVADLKETKE